ncbi:cytosine deaminase [Ancylobacter terrae]|uniref:cytosine deaminase n=1 Tax=Ancylobacter sp. sgz301288 TaxID=3342077 RepID=UPI00385F0357
MALDLAPLPTRYVLTGTRVPACLLDAPGPADAEGLARAEIAIVDGRFAAAGDHAELPRLDLAGRLVLPGLVDIHTHLDKAFIWPRAPNPDGTFIGAISAVAADRQARWRADDVAARMEFALRCAHARGTVAIRTHLDSIGPQTAISWEVFDDLRARWAGRIALQAVSLVPPEHVLEDALFAPVLEAARRHGGALGVVAQAGPRVAPALERLFAAAEAHGLDLDLHLDETGDPASHALRTTAEIAIRRRFAGRILAGHCCSLAVQAAGEAGRTLDLVAQAGIGVVSLPLCNLYLQDRASGRTPRWRGLTLLHEMKARGIPVMVASDNVRDPFYAYGDFDLVEVLRAATRIGHLDHPFADWPATIAATPAAAMGVDAGRIAAGRPADLILFEATSLNELMSRPGAARTVLRAGRAIDTTPPDYRELDALMEPA